MHTATKPLHETHETPSALATAAASLAAFGSSIAWALAMRQECDRWTRSGRRLDGDAIRQIYDRLST